MNERPDEKPNAEPAPADTPPDGPADTAPPPEAEAASPGEPVLKKNRKKINPAESPVRWALAVVSSLRLTVVLFGLLIFIVFAGTLAQAEYSNLTVIEEYFRCYFTQVELKIFFPKGSDLYEWAGDKWFPFPGGWLIGGLMLVNLIAAHAFRFKVTGKGKNLWIGLAVTALGIAASAWAVISVFDIDGTRREIGSYYRIMLQLAQGGGAAVVLLIGCWYLFRKRAGIVVLHAGIILLMISELLTGEFSVEANMRLTVGQSLNYAEEYQQAELAFVTSKNQDLNEVVAIDEEALREAAETKKPIKQEPLPVHVQVLRYLPNSELRGEKTDQTLKNLATAGRGRKYHVIEKPEAIGADANQAVPMPSAYIKVTTPGGEDLGVYLLGYPTYMMDGPETLRVGDRTYEVALRPKRHYLYTSGSERPYSIHLDKFVHKKYAGTERPKDFSSYVTVRDPDRGVERPVRIWMNHPLYY
ncbi:MAG: cytochrome c biogenesis protein ResB, partial [Phycisphaeraceae bacterium]|nr:cytochrome c biogenesis protein ResB [Phycisphaeraceae bacterium]